MSKYKYILRLLLWLLLLAYLFVMMSFVRSKRHRKVCESVCYEINSNHAFVDTADLYRILKQDSLYPQGKTVQELQLLAMENAIETHEAIKNAEVYCDMDARVYILVEQRNPLLRIITRNHANWYVDDELGLMSVNYRYTADVPILSGYVEDTLLSAFKAGNDTLHLNNVNFCMRDIITFVDYLYNDKLWRNMFVQLYINENYEFELIPRVGNQIIILGDLNEYEYKMKKLLTMYKKAFPKYGWHDYKVINLKYSNQVVCSK